MYLQATQVGGKGVQERAVVLMKCFKSVTSEGNQILGSQPSGPSRVKQALQGYPTPGVKVMGYLSNNPINYWMKAAPRGC